MGSPVASTATGRPRRRRISSTVRRSGVAQLARSALIVSGSMARWRSPPTTSSAPLDQAAAERRQLRPAALAEPDDGEPAAHAAPSPISKRIDGGGSHGAAAAPAAQGDEGNAQCSRGQQLLRFRSTDEAHRKGQDRRRPIAVEIDPLDQAEQRRRRIADGDHAAIQPLAPEIDGGSAARIADPAAACCGRSVFSVRNQRSRSRPADGGG